MAVSQQPALAMVAQIILNKLKEIAKELLRGASSALATTKGK